MWIIQTAWLEVPGGFLQPLWNLRSSEEMEIINLSTTSLCKLGYNKEIAFFRGYKMWYTQYFVLIVTEQTVVIVGHDILITWLLGIFIWSFWPLIRTIFDFFGCTSHPLFSFLSFWSSNSIQSFLKVNSLLKSLLFWHYQFQTFSHCLL